MIGQFLFFALTRQVQIWLGFHFYPENFVFNSHIGSITEIEPSLDAFMRVIKKPIAWYHEPITAYE